jgi:hypothetical protein
MECKDETIGHILAARQIKSGDAAMIGDRSHDVLGARQPGCRPGFGLGDTARAMNSPVPAHSRAATNPPGCLVWPRFDDSRGEARGESRLGRKSRSDVTQLRSVTCRRHRE